MSNNISLVTMPSWFIPLDIIMILCSTLAIGLALIYLILILFDRTCHTISMMLVANSCLAEFLLACFMLASAIFTFENDLKQASTEDSLCILRGYLGYIVIFLQNWSYVLQSMYRYFIVVYPTYLTYQSFHLQFFLISLLWILAFLSTIPYLVTQPIYYDFDNQICQMPLRLSFLSIYNALCVYLIPISLIIWIYFKLIQYVREINKRTTPIGLVTRAQRELKMVRRIVILVLGLATVGFPYTLFVFWPFFFNPPQYHFRIAYLFVHVSLAFVMIVLLKFTEPLKTSIMKIIKRQTNRIIPIIA